MYKKEIANSYGITVITLNKWLKRVKNLGKPIGKHFTDKQILKIEKEFGKINNNKNNTL